MFFYVKNVNEVRNSLRFTPFKLILFITSSYTQFTMKFSVHMIRYKKKPYLSIKRDNKGRCSSHRRVTPMQFFVCGLMAVCMSDTIYAADLHDPSSAHTPVILSRSKMTDVPNLFDIIWKDQGGLRKIETYLDKGGDPNLIEGTGQKRSLLEMFAYAGHETFVDTLLTKGASVSYVDANGNNAF
jgi:hypothetical protein